MRRRTALPALVAALVAAGCAPGPSGRAPLPETYGWRLMERRCQSCHALPDPASRNRDAWLKGLERMKKRFRLEPADWDTLAALAPRDSTLAR